MKTLTRKLNTAAEYLDKGYGGFFTVMGLAGLNEQEQNKVRALYSMGKAGTVTLTEWCGKETSIHVPTDLTPDEKALLLSFAARLNETGDL